MPKHEPGTPLPAAIATFLDAPRYATIATLDPDGSPRTGLVWYRRSDSGLVLNSLEGRTWPANLRRDGRISIAVHDAADPMIWVGLSGIARVDEDRQRGFEEIAGMARRYREPDAAEHLIETRYRAQTRVSFDVEIDEYHDHLDG